ncbi:MAG: hypothetical protein ABSC06_31035 [Rhodopila sp.]|jgi:hypothetical protein
MISDDMEPGLCRHVDMVGFTRDFVETTGYSWDIIEPANAALVAIREMRVTSSASEAFIRSRIAWRLEGYRVGMIYRVSELAHGAVDAWMSGNVLVSALCSRSLLETVAALLYARKKLIDSTKDNDADAALQLVLKLVLGGKATELLGDEFVAVNVITLVKKMDKQHPGLWDHYQIVSEACHPNGMGHAGMFAKWNFPERRIETYLGRDTFGPIFAIVGWPYSLLPQAEEVLRELPEVVGTMARRFPDLPDPQET